MRIPLVTRYPDYDPKGHVNNAVYLTYFEIARSHCWVEVLGQRRDAEFILAEATVRFLSQARLGELLEIEMTTAEVRTKAWVWSYVVRCAGDGRVVAEGRTVQVMYDYEAERTVPIPDWLRAALATV
jgi:acyl-CoA thioester hydrolase